jgi:hypothetical protein
MVHFQSQVDVGEIGEGASEESRADQQQEHNRHLRRHQRLTKEGSHPAGAALARLGLNEAQRVVDLGDVRVSSATWLDAQHQ